MAQNETTDGNNTTRQEPQDSGSVPKKKQTRALLTVFLVFFSFVTVVLITQRKDTIDWTEDYEAGLELAKQQNKPVLLVFCKKFTRYSSEMWQDFYSSPEVKEFVEASFIPILIDVNKQPELAKLYNVTYYPTHYIKHPDSNEIAGPFAGVHRLFDFIEENAAPRANGVTPPDR